MGIHQKTLKKSRLQTKYLRKMKIIIFVAIFALLVQLSDAACRDVISGRAIRSRTKTCRSKDGFGRVTKNTLKLKLNSDCTGTNSEIFITCNTRGKRCKSSPEIKTSDCLAGITAGTTTCRNAPCA